MKAQGNFQFVLFDLDDTIFNFSKCENKALKQVLAERSLVLTDGMLKKYLDINARMWTLYEEGKIEQDYLSIKRFELLFNEYDINLSAKTISEEYQKALCNTAYLEKGAKSVLSSLSQKYQLYVVSNGQYTTQFKRAQKANILQYFMGFYISSEIGYRKPQLEFFDICCSRAGIAERSKALLIGDSLFSDILGASAAGIKTCWYNPTRERSCAGYTVDYQISSLKELLNIL